MNNKYDECINVIIEYIENNLSKDISLEILAKQSNFSLYHFCRVFKSVTKESPASFIRRKRLLKSIHYLINTSLSIAEIAYKSGFNSASNFNTNFKKQYLVTPSIYRINNSKNEKDFSNYEKDFNYLKCNNITSKGGLLNRIWNMNIKTIELPKIEVAYIRNTGSYLSLDNLWIKLVKWGLGNVSSLDNVHFIGTPLDDVTESREHDCRYDACISLPEDFVKGEHDDVLYKEIPGGLYLNYNFYDTSDKLFLLYQSIYDNFIPNSDYVLDDREILEYCKNNPSTDPDNKCKVDIYIPIKEKKVLRIEKLEKKMIVGVSSKMTHQNDQTLELWQKFMKKVDNVKYRINKDYISLSSYKEGFEPGMEFQKWAAVEVSDENEDLDNYIIDGGLYVVVVHKGPASTFYKTQNYILNEYLPSSEYELDSREHFEILPYGYSPIDENATEEVWIPIRIKE